MGMFTPEWKYRRLDVDRDAAALLGEHVFEPGETVRWISSHGIDGYLIPGRTYDGTVVHREGETRKTVLKWIARPVVFLIGMLLDTDAAFDVDSRMRMPPRGIVYGPDADCIAVYSPYTPLANEGEGVWVLTDRRFARVRLDPVLEGTERLRLVRAGDNEFPMEPIGFTIEFETPAASVRFNPAVKREFKGRIRTRRAVYDSFTFADGSGIDVITAKRRTTART